MEKLQKIIDDKKRKSANTKPKYNMRKLKVGFVSVFLGLSILLSSVGSFAQELTSVNEEDLGGLKLQEIANAMNVASESDEPNYSTDEKEIKDYSGSERYKETDLQPGSTTVENFNTDEKGRKRRF